MFKTRLLSGIVLVAFLLCIGFFGGDVLLVSLGAISLVGAFELYRVFRMEKKALAFPGYLAIVAYYVSLRLGWMSQGVALFLLLVCLLVVLMGIYVFAYPKYHCNQLMAAFFGVFYIAFMLSCIYLIREMEGGIYLIWLIFLCSWGADTCAYCVGMLFGKHSLSPKLSPKKSIEGAVGGILGAALLTVIYTLIFQEKMGLGWSQILILAAISAVAAAVSIIGDLVASGIKRNYDIKDYGKLIPGHGGILDRFDSVIVTAPILYFLAFYFIVR